MQTGNGGIGNASIWNVSNRGSDSSKGLTESQLSDAQFYANGTINQVLAGRAAVAQAAAQEAAFLGEVARTGSTIATEAQTASATPPDTSMSKAGDTAASTKKSQAIDEVTKTIEEKIKTEDEGRDRRRKAAAANNPARSGGSGAGFGATIRSIDVDGKRFDLDGGGAGKNGGSENNNNSGGVPASGGAAQ